MGVLLIAALAVRAVAAGYENLLEQGEFYLGRGPTYSADAVRVLEQAREVDPAAAEADPRWLLGLAKAYARTARFTEAFWLLQRLDAVGGMDPEAAGLRDKILLSSGLGRLRVESALSLPRVAMGIVPAEETRLDVLSRKALGQLDGMLGVGFPIGPEGVTVLVPEGSFRVTFQASELFAPRDPVPVEVWAGEEARVRLTPRFPNPSQWQTEARSRSVALGWPALADAEYRLYRRLGEEETLVYGGSANFHLDTGLAVGAGVRYRLEVLDRKGRVVAASEVEAETLPAVSAVTLRGRYAGDLRVELQWEAGYGAVDRVRVLRAEAEEVTLAEFAGPQLSATGKVSDGPLLPGATGRDVHYRVEAWVDGADAPSAVAATAVTVPPLVLQITAVAESIDRGAVLVAWDTFPREGVAQGYAVFRELGEGVEGELVGRVEDPFARQFEYAVADPLAASDWRHYVIPYLGQRYLLDPQWLRLRGDEPGRDLEQRHRMRQELPDLGLAWDPYPGARVYLVAIGDREVMVRRPFLEVDGLQTTLMATDQRISVRAVDAEGEQVPLLSVEARYEHYPRVGKEGMGE